MSYGDGGARRKHIVLCAALGRGHTTPMVCLARSLALTGKASITVIFQNLASLQSVNHKLKQGLDIKFITLKPEDNGDAEDPPWMPHMAMRVRGKLSMQDPDRLPCLPYMFPDLEEALEHLLKQLMASNLPPSCIINDFSLSWVAAPALQLKIPRYVLYTDPASFMALAFHCRVLFATGIFPIKDITQKFEVPGIPDLYPHDVTQFVWDPRQKAYPMQACWHQQILESAAGILLNTFYELEPGPIDALRQQTLKNDRGLPGSIYPVGPLISSSLQAFTDDHTDDDLSVFQSSLSVDTCMDWLNSKEPGSVLYISFGSWEFLPDEQVPELALGLQASGCPFLWMITLPPGRELDDILPGVLLEQICKDGSGLIFSEWVPQQRILKHSSIGGFLTHCGWNSVIECISLAGVPMICWPFVADQPTTCRFLVDGLKIAVEVCEDDQGIVDKSQVEKLVRLVMFEGDKMTSRAKILKERARNAVEGSSKQALDSFMHLV